MTLISKKQSASLPTEYGEFTIHVYQDREGNDHAALIKDPINDAPLVRVHSECLTGDAFHSIKCDCQKQLDTALQKIGEKGGILIYLRQEGRGIGLFNKIRAYHLQDGGLDTVEANEELGFKSDMRNYDIAAEILKDLNVSSISLLTNNPAKIEELKKSGIEIANRVPLIIKPNEKNKDYLNTKVEKMGHMIKES